MINDGKEGRIPCNKRYQRCSFHYWFLITKMKWETCTSNLDYSLLFIKYPSHVRVCFSYSCGTLQVLITFLTTWIKTEISPPMKSFPFAVLLYIFITSKERGFLNAESLIYGRWDKFLLQKWTLINEDLSVLSHTLIWFFFYLADFFFYSTACLWNDYLKIEKKKCSEFLKPVAVGCPF